MSSFLADPSARKRKRTAASDAPKKRLATIGSGRAGGNTKHTGGSAKKDTRSKSSSAPINGRKAKSGKSAATAKNAADDDDESISGSDSDDDDVLGRGKGANSDEDGSGFFSEEEDDNSDLEGEDGEELTAAERRRRIAERYLKNIKEELGDEGDRDHDDGDEGSEDGGKETYIFDAKDVDRDLIAERLREDIAESKGRVYRKLADELQVANASHCLMRWNAENVNAVAVCAPYAYTVSSDAYLTKWRIQDSPEQQQAERLAKYEAYQATKNKKKNKKSKKSKAGMKDVPTKKQPERLLYRRGDTRRRRDRTYQGHVDAILCVAASQDGRYVVTGGADRRMVVWDAATLKVLRVFSKHRDAVTGLVFRRGTNQLYSCSADRSIMVWSLDELAYVQALFGHQNKVVAIDALAQERCLSVGSRDRTARLWKVVEETQLVFRGGLNVARLVGEHRIKKGQQQQNGDEHERGDNRIDSGSLAHEGSMDCVAMLDDELFVTGSDNGALALWSTQKKKPLWVVPRAHGLEPVMTGREDYDRAFADPAVSKANPPPAPQPRWITALRTIPYSDVILSGSWDGCVRMWRLSEDKRKLEAIGVLGEDEKAAKEQSEEENERSEYSKKVRIRGVINSIAVFERGDRGKEGLSVVVAVGREHRLGRWSETAGARNGAIVFEVPRQSVGKRLANGINGVTGMKLLTDGVSKFAP